MAFRRRIQLMLKPVIRSVTGDEPAPTLSGSLCHDGFVIKPSLTTSIKELKPSLGGTITVKPGVSLVSQLNC